MAPKIIQIFSKRTIETIERNKETPKAEYNYRTERTIAWTESLYPRGTLWAGNRTKSDFQGTGSIGSSRSDRLILPQQHVLHLIPPYLSPVLVPSYI
jgi:hypothetical protein